MADVDGHGLGGGGNRSEVLFEAPPGEHTPGEFILATGRGSQVVGDLLDGVRREVGQFGGELAGLGRQLRSLDLGRAGRAEPLGPDEPGDA